MVCSSVSYLKIFMHVRASKRRVAQDTKGTNEAQGNKSSESKLTRSLLIIFFVFIICWTPYSLLLVVGKKSEAEISLEWMIGDRGGSRNFSMDWEGGFSNWQAKNKTSEGGGVGPSNSSNGEGSEGPRKRRSVGFFKLTRKNANPPGSATWWKDLLPI